MPPRPGPNARPAVVLRDIEHARTAMYTVEKYGTTIIMTDEQIADDEAFRQGLADWANATPEDRAQRAADARARRSAEREAADRVPFTVAGLAAKTGWTAGYIEHLVQPYCGCWQGYDGWEYCDHARDLGMAG
ncbi:hypothetical protein Acsp01_87020 [Actinoplanes sp. NBRC 101535]|nr:hypothetical protein Acsp01_87020 [Actinoplanes sp. NBRC 101535]